LTAALTAEEKLGVLTRYKLVTIVGGLKVLARKTGAEHVKVDVCSPSRRSRMVPVHAHKWHFYELDINY
jgi:hypothetical protein